MQQCQAITQRGTRCRNKGTYAITSHNVYLCGVHYDKVNEGLTVNYFDANRNGRTINGGK